MNIVFMGTPAFAVPSLAILIDNGYGVAAVVSAPDAPRGRGQKVSPTPVKEFALRHHLPVIQPEKLREEWFIQRLQGLSPDLIVVVAYRILPKEVFTLPRLGSFNLHASLLPKYRGAAPINWAIMNGEKETGATTFFLQEQVDTGNIILQERISIGEDEAAGELHDRLSDLGARLVLKTVRLIESGNVVVSEQDNNLATPAPKIFREQCQIDWSKNAQEIHNFVRGLSPSPCAYTYHKEKLLRVYRTQIVDKEKTGESGRVRVVEDGLWIQTGRGRVALVEIQQEGKKRMAIGEFLRGYHLKNGDRLGHRRF
jgi:methionyl-tRNA formyltransferase